MPATTTDTVSAWLPYLVILGPLLGAILLPLVAWGLARVTGLEAKLHDWLVAHQQSKAADLVDSAWGQIDRAVETSAGVLAGQMTNGDLSWTDRAAWEAKAKAEIATIEQRAPGAIAQAATSAPVVLAQLMASVDAKMVAAPPTATPIAGAQMVLGSTVTAADTISDAVATIAGARTALAALDGSAAAPVPDPAPAAPAPAADAAPATVVVTVSGAQPAPPAPAPDPALSPGGVILPGFPTPAAGTGS